MSFNHLFWKYKLKPSGILHLGANTGQEAEAYAQLGVTNVIWVEALPQVYRQLTTHISQFSGQQALLACVSDRDREHVRFNVASNEGQSSSMLEFGTHTKEHPTVKFTGSIELVTTRVDSLLLFYNIRLRGDQWFLNADLQGAELLALKGMGTLLSQFSDAYIEVNERELYKGCPLVPEIDAFLETQGFVGMECKMTGSGWGDKYYRRC